MSELQEALTKLNACSGAVEWVGDRDLATAWKECNRADWMLWLCGKMTGKKGWPTRQELVLAACDCAETVLPIFEKKYPNDKRPRTAIETARKWAEGKASIEEVRAAYADTANAAYAAANADDAAAYAANAADAAADAAAYADDAAANAVRAKKLKEMAVLVRERLHIPKEF